MDTYETNRLYTAPQYLWQEEPKMSNEKIIGLFKRFVKEFHTKSTFHYREQFMSNIKKSEYYLECSFEDINNFDEQLANLLSSKPAESIPMFEKALKDLLLEFSIQYKKLEEVPEIQFILTNNSNPRNLRELNSGDVNQLVVVSGIITSSTKPSIKASKLALQCRNCGNIKTIKVVSGFGGVSIPRTCDNAQAQGNNKEKCPLDSYIIIPELCEYIDQQTLKLQETPENIPTGEIPRSFQMYGDMYFVNKVTPGVRLTIVGIYTANDNKNFSEKEQFQKAYIKIIGMQIENQKSGKYIFNFTQEDEQKFIAFSKDPSKLVI